MVHELEDIIKSQQIFYYLLKKKEIAEDRDQEREYYSQYTENEAVMDLVKRQGDCAECDVERYGNTIYLIPRETNDFLGYSKAQLKQELCKSGATDKDYYLSQFVILTLLVEFYNGQGSSCKVRDFIKVGELLNCVSDRLKQGMEFDEEQEDANGIAFHNMSEAYQALKSSETGSRAKTTKEGFVYTILTFLEKQGLIDYIEADEMIKTTKKLDYFMDWNLLNKNNFQRVLKVLGVEDHE